MADLFTTYNYVIARVACSHQFLLLKLIMTSEIILYMANLFTTYYVIARVVHSSCYAADHDI